MKHFDPYKVCSDLTNNVYNDVYDRVTGPCSIKFHSSISRRVSTESGIAPSVDIEVRGQINVLFDGILTNIETSVAELCIGVY